MTTTETLATTTDQISAELHEEILDEGRSEAREHLGRYLQEMSEAFIQDCLPAGTELTEDMVLGFRLAASLVRDQTWDY